MSIHASAGRRMDEESLPKRDRPLPSPGTGGTIEVGSERRRMRAPGMELPEEHVTQMLREIAGGDSKAADRLLPAVYDELRRLARSRMSKERAGLTLDPTALVHEAYLRVIGGAQDQQWDHRGHFFAAAALAMRRILVERARHAKRLRHGGGRDREDLGEHSARVEGEEPIDLIAARRSPPETRVVRPGAGPDRESAVLRRAVDRRDRRCDGPLARDHQDRVGVRARVAATRHGRRARPGRDIPPR